MANTSDRDHFVFLIAEKKGRGEGGFSCGSGWWHCEVGELEVNPDALLTGTSLIPCANALGDFSFIKKLLGQQQCCQFWMLVLPLLV